MIITIMDLFYIFMIAVIFGFIIHLEAQMSMVKKMMEEHVRTDDSIKELCHKLNQNPIDE
tara:strand:- start:1832 stop:2011 length:180 start_codon:yes stop_codon:yes gene_type:complete